MPRAAARRAAGPPERLAIQPQSARILAPLLPQLRPRQLLGFGRAGGFLRGRQLRRRQLRPSTTVRLLAAHSRSWVERRDHAVMVSAVHPGDLGHPGGGSTGAHSNPIERCSSRRSVA